MAELSQNGEIVFRSRYSLSDSETWAMCAERVAKNIGAVEKEGKYIDLFAEVISNMEFIPGGRILRNSGRPRGSLLNCFVLPCLDSIEAIGQFLKDALVLWSEGGGVGCNFSAVRPAGDEVRSKGGRSSGVVSFIEAADAVAKTVQSGGSRRAASLFCLDVFHPEILNFINAKLVDKRLSHCNISVNINNDFLEHVERGDNIDLRFQQRTYATVNAKEIWDKMLSNMISSAEPGLLNTSNLYKNNSYYFAPISSTNPCGEACLEHYGCCCLGSIVLPKFVNETGRVNWKRLEEVISLAVRFLDDVLDVNKYTVHEISEAARVSRRIGLGIMGLAEFFFQKKLRYGSRESILELERVMRFIRDTAYMSSIELAWEKGAFPKFDPIAYSKASFIRKLPAAIRKEIKSKGTRNVTIMSIAPTGTISLLAEVTGGCEPLFSKAYKRSDRVGERIYINKVYASLLTSACSGSIPDWLVDSYDLLPKDHLEIQSTIQKFTDGAVSKTINLPADTDVDQLSEWLLEYIYELKGVTVYVDGSREGQILNRLSHEEVLKLSNASYIDDGGVRVCPTGKCDL
jgi:ribonucleoside-diphosphate reductase alpha chain